MRPVLVAISSSDATALRAECARLGIRVSSGTQLKTMQKELRAYSQNYTLWQRWMALAGMLFGENPEIDTVNHDEVINGVMARLYGRLAEAGFATLEHPIRDDRNALSFTITGQQGDRNVNVYVNRDDGTSNQGAVSILYAAQCAFPDVAATVAAWEAQRKGGK